MALHVINEGLDTRFLDVECRLVGAKVDWNFISKVYEADESAKEAKKDEYDSKTLEALNFYKKKRLWVNLKFATSFDRYLSTPCIFSEEIELIKRAKDWVLEASPVEWEGRVACLEISFVSWPSKRSLDKAKGIYKLLL